MSIYGKIEAIIYAAEEPVSLDQLASLLKEAGLLDALMRPAPSASDDAEGSVAAEADSNEAPAPAAKDPKAEKAEVRAKLRDVLEEIMAAYTNSERGMEIRQVAGGYRMSTKPEHHDVVRSFAKSLKPPIRLSLQALETLAVIAYKQPVTGPEISEIRGVDSSGVLATLLDRKLITTAGRKAVVGRPILYKTTKDFILRFGLKDVHELPSMEEFEKMTTGQEDLFDHSPVADATGIPDESAPAFETAEESAEPSDSTEEHEPRAAED
ncbi:MAG: SMC-Scp complex subunit ScpB [Terriglobales bacterium]